MQRRRTDHEVVQQGDFYSEARRYFDHTMELTVVKLFSGDCYISPGGEMLVTILGSCVSACVRDPRVGVAGMNHFLLPGEAGAGAANGEAARYGVHAMEQLINGILARGGRKEQLEVKLFGGGNVLNHSSNIGGRNVAFIEEFARKEGLAVQASDLGGPWPRRVHYFTDSGKVRVRRLQREDDARILDAERRYESRLRARPIEGEVELF
jgi:chemotaxis protein CheD